MTRPTEAGNAARPSNFDGPPAFGTFMGFAGIEEEDEDIKEDWFKNTEEHHTLAGGYRNVNIYLTLKDKQKWCYTDMRGVLRVIQVKEADGYPVIILQLTGQDDVGTERDVVFEFELPVNFTLEPDLTSQFSAIAMTNGEYIGFLFSSFLDKEDFTGKMGEIQNQLRLPQAKFEEFKAGIVAKQKEEQANELAEQIDCFNILSGQDEDRRAQDMRKILILAGLRVEHDLSNPETMALI